MEATSKLSTFIFVITCAELAFGFCGVLFHKTEWLEIAGLYFLAMLVVRSERP